MVQPLNIMGFPDGTYIPPAQVGNARDTGSIPGSGRPPGGGRGNPLQDSCLGNPMGRGAWWATIYGVAKSQAPLRDRALLTAKNLVYGVIVSPKADFC